MADQDRSVPAAVSPEVAQASGAIRRMLAKLRAPAAVPPARTRPLAGRPPLGLLSAIIEEIDETVMARTLVLRNAAGEEVRLGVCNRRLLHAGAPGERALHNLTYAGGGDLAALRAALEHFCAPGGVTVAAAPASGSATLEQTGVAVATLRDAWDDAAPPLAPDPTQDGTAPPAADAAPRSTSATDDGTGVQGQVARPGHRHRNRDSRNDKDGDVDEGNDGSALRRFCEGCAAEAEAMLAIGTRGGEVRRGDTERAEALAAALAGPAADLLQGGDGAVLLEVQPDRPALLLAAHGRERAALRLRPGRSAAVLRRWTASFGAADA
jgi:hypothetical protein